MEVHMNVLSRLARVARCRAGAATIETAAMLPLFAVLLAGLFDFGSGVMNAMALSAAARAGAQYALTQPTDQAGIAAVVAAATRLDPTSLTITTSSTCECPGGSSVGCGGTCGPQVLVRRFVSVKVTQPFTTILPYPAFLRPSTLSGSAILRVT
jgi:Flp pilus assembly protein TadG